MTEDAVVRSIRVDELEDLLELYKHLHMEDAPLLPADRLHSLWEQILQNHMLDHVVAELDSQLVASCSLAIIPNLTRRARPYGLIENVVAHADYRRRGLGTAVLQHALGLAWDADCYKVMLLTGRKEPEVHRFYEQAGFQKDIKTGFIARPPTRTD